MSSDSLDNVIRHWTRAGVVFGATPSPRTPDLEWLLMETARHAHLNARLFTLAVTWLCRYELLVAPQRLFRHVVAELEEEFKPAFGVLLATLKHITHTRRFNDVIAACPPARLPGPLFDIYRGNKRLEAVARRQASPWSVQWNLWAPPVEPKFDALRPPSWLMRNNPAFRTRAAMKGDLRASVLAELADNPEAGASESRLARACGVTRPPLRQALDDLELMATVERVTEGKRRTIRLVTSPS